MNADQGHPGWAPHLAPTTSNPYTSLTPRYTKTHCTLHLLVHLHPRPHLHLSTPGPEGSLCETKRSWLHTDFITPTRAEDCRAKFNHQVGQCCPPSSAYSVVRPRSSQRRKERGVECSDPADLTTLAGAARSPYNHSAGQNRVPVIGVQCGAATSPAAPDGTLREMKRAC